MRFRLRSPKDGEKDGFSRDLATVEWTFKFCGWIVLIGTLQYAAEATGHLVFKIIAFILTMEITYLAFSFAHNRLDIRIIDEGSSSSFARSIANILFGVLFAWICWQGALHVVKIGVQEVIEFNKKNR